MLAAVAVLLLLAALPAGVLTTTLQFRAGRLERPYGGPTVAAVAVMGSMTALAVVLAALSR